MTHNELRDIAYLTATGNHLLVAFNYEEFQEASEEDIQDVIWEPLEYWPIGNVIEHIAQIAEQFISRVEQAQKN